MKVTGSEMALLHIAVHYQEGIKINVNKCGLFLKFSSLEKNLSTQQVNISFIFS